MQKYREKIENKWNNRLIKDFKTIIVEQANSIAFKVGFIIGLLNIIVIYFLSKNLN